MESISFPKLEYSHVSLADCILPYTDCPGFDVAIISNIDSVLACQRQCEIHSDCMVFTFQDTHNTCFLKNKYRYGPCSSQPGFTSGYKRCNSKSLSILHTDACKGWLVELPVMKVYALEDNAEVGEAVLGRCSIPCVCTSAF